MPHSVQSATSGPAAGSHCDERSHAAQSAQRHSAPHDRPLVEQSPHASTCSEPGSQAPWPSQGPGSRAHTPSAVQLRFAVPQRPHGSRRADPGGSQLHSSGEVQSDHAPFWQTVTPFPQRFAQGRVVPGMICGSLSSQSAPAPKVSPSSSSLGATQLPRLQTHPTWQPTFAQASS